MKKHLSLFIFIFLSVCHVYSQRNISWNALTVGNHHFITPALKMVNDTVWPASFTGNCLDSLKLYYADRAPHDSGWVCGSNGWQDKEKAQKFYLGSTSIIGVIPFFGIRRGTNGTIYAKIYARDASTKGPGVLLGTSTGIAMSAIDTFHQGINFRNMFHFSAPVSVSDTFFVSFTMPPFVNAVNELALISESISCSQSGRYNAWEQWSDNTWHSFYSVYSANIDMAVFPVISVPSTQNDILTFYLPQQLSPATVNPSLHQVYIQVASGTDVTTLTPAITVSPYATISPLSGTPQNFSSPFTYNVTAENGAIQPWVINVNVAPPPRQGNNILTFTVPQFTGMALIDTINHTVSGEVTHGTSRTALVPGITVSPGATINPPAGVAQNFTNPFAYTVTAENGTPQNWIVTITEAAALRHGKNILTFTLPEQESPAVIDTITHFVSIVVQAGTDRSNLTPAISVSPGASINPPGGTAQNFSTPFAYTVTAEDMTSQNWVVSVSLAVGVIELDNTSLIVYPNPVIDMLNVCHPGVNAYYKVFDITGRVIIEGSLNDKGGTVDFSLINPGIYILHLIQNTRAVVTKTVVKQ